MTDLFLRKKRYPFRLVGDEYTREKRTDEVLNEGVDFVDELDGETILTATWSVVGPTITGTTITAGRDSTDTKVTFTVTSTGSAVLKVTTSGVRTLERRFRWEGTDNNLEDY